MSCSGAHGTPDGGVWANLPASRNSELFRTCIELFGRRQACGGGSAKSVYCRRAARAEAPRSGTVALHTVFQPPCDAHETHRKPRLLALDRKNQLSNIVEAIKALRRREAAPIAPKRRIAFPRAGQALRFGRRQARPVFSGFNRRTQFPNFIEAVTAPRRREAAPITPRQRIVFPRAGHLKIPPDPDTYNLRPVLRMSKPQDDVPTSRELRLSPASKIRFLDIPRTWMSCACNSDLIQFRYTPAMYRISNSMEVSRVPYVQVSEYLIKYPVARNSGSIM
ncbi:hypothetical protein B0H11DRAFT_1901790 [Mycena galericulata]|nr:hypothetical protein B0H11DRAFT_1901784 [Mycena galericulata]KAJ7509022.1 hypothetical protein B0H11DRAFT_1901790 [Mycena galericulata]